MPANREQPALWGIVAGVVAVLVVVVVIAVRDDDDSGAGSEGDGATRTEIDIDDPRSDEGTVRATVIADDAERCVWLVDVAGADPGTRLVVAWPEGAQLEWDPFTLRIDGTGGAAISQGTPVTVTGQLVAGDEDLDDAAFDRLLGQFRCPYDAVFVADADTDSVTVRGGS